MQRMSSSNTHSSSAQLQPHLAALANPAALPATLSPSAVPARKRLTSQSLLGNEREIEIEHSGQLYRLRLTSLGKLILTK